jgi:hypothetical protein
MRTADNDNQRILSVLNILNQLKILMRVFSVIIFLILIAGACKSNYRKAADEIASKIPPSEAVNMNAGKETYTIYVPDGWSTKYKREYGVEYYFISAPKTIDNPNTNINVTTEFMQDLSLEDYAELTVTSIKNNIPGANILDQGSIIANGLEGRWYCYQMETQGIKATLTSYIFPKNGVAYIITAGTQTKDASKFKATFDTVAKSFKFNN